MISPPAVRAMETEQQKTIQQFGVFELDLRTGELGKHGIRLKQPTPVVHSPDPQYDPKRLGRR